MSFFNYGKRVKNKTFGYIPQHYDAIEEELRAKYPKYYATEEGANSTEMTKMRIQSGLRMKSRASKDIKKKANKSANIRLVIIIGMLLVLCYYVLKSDAFEVFLDSILNGV